MPETLPQGRAVSHFRIEGRLGAGGMGVIYKARDLRLDRDVALKFLDDAGSHDPESLARFLREARSAATLSHPNICTIYEAGESDGRPFIAMELLEGHSLEERLSAGPLGVDEALEVAVHVVSALAAAHAKRLVHRDIKPANVFLTSAGPAKVLDFGIAKPEAASSTGRETTTLDEAQLTGPRTIVGTAAYMSPEQALGEHVDARSDIFSLGIVLYDADADLPLAKQARAEYAKLPQ